MKTAQFIAWILLVQWALSVTVNAQPPVRRPRAAERPRISPYIDLVQDDNNRDDAFQYFRRVRPDVEFRKTENKLRQDLNSLSKSVTESQTQTQSVSSMLGTTGHAASFMTHHRYFNNGARSGGR